MVLIPIMCSDDILPGSNLDFIYSDYIRRYKSIISQIRKTPIAFMYPIESLKNVLSNIVWLLHKNSLLCYYIYCFVVIVEDE